MRRLRNTEGRQVLQVTWDQHLRSPAGQSKRVVSFEALEERYASTRGGAGDIAQVLIGLGEFDRACEWLSRAVDGGVKTLKVAVVWDPIRSDPRFEEVLRKSGPWRVSIPAHCDGVERNVESANSPPALRAEAEQRLRGVAKRSALIKCATGIDVAGVHHRTVQRGDRWPGAHTSGRPDFSTVDIRLTRELTFAGRPVEALRVFEAKRASPAYNIGWLARMSWLVAVPKLKDWPAPMTTHSGWQ